MRFLEHGDEIKFKTGDKILSAGHRDNHIYYLLEGSVQAKLAGQNEDFFVQDYAENSLIGVVNNFINNGKQMLDVVALTDCVCYSWEKNTFVDQIGLYQELARKTITELTLQLRFLNKILADLQEE